MENSLDMNLVNEFIKAAHEYYEAYYDLNLPTRKVNKLCDKLIKINEKIKEQENYMDYFDYLLSLKLKFVDAYVYSAMFAKKYRIRETEQHAMAKSKSRSMTATVSSLFLNESFGHDSKWGKGKFGFTKEELEKDDKICAERIKQGKFKPRTSWEFEPSRHLSK